MERKKISVHPEQLSKFIANSELKVFFGHSLIILRKLIILCPVLPEYFKVVPEGFHTRFRKLRICVIWVNTIVCIIHISPNHTDFGIHNSAT